MNLSRSAAPSLLASGAILCVAACSAPSSTTNSPRIQARAGDAIPAERRIYAYNDQTLVLPLSRASASAASLDEPNARADAYWRPARRPVVRLQNGAFAECQLMYFHAKASASAPESRSEWLPSPPEWSATEWEATTSPGWQPEGPGFWALLIPPPPNGARQGVRLNDSLLPILWLTPPPPSTDATRSPRPRFSQDPLQTTAALRAAGEGLRAWSADPIVGWRIRVLGDRIRPADLFGVDRPPAPSDSAVLALAAQTERRWRSAIAILERDDPDVAANVVGRLTAVVSVPGDLALPAWPLEDSGLQSLRLALLSPTSTRDQRIDAAQLWLSSVPPAVALIIDDGQTTSTSTESRRVLTSITNLTIAPVVGSTAVEGSAATNAATIPAHATVVFETRIPVAQPRPVVVARSGAWSQRLAVSAPSLRAAPPGLTLGPLWPALNLPAWLAGGAINPDPGVLCAAVVQRAPTDASAAERWEIYVEATGRVPNDTVTLWFGPSGASTATVKCGPGATSDDAAPRLHRLDNRWWTIVPIPPGAMNDGGRVLIGISRGDSTSSMWAWPRPLAPGQAEPVRALIDLSAWSTATKSQFVEPSAGNGER